MTPKVDKPSPLFGVIAADLRVWTRAPAFARVAPFFSFIVVLALTPLVTAAWLAGLEAWAQWLHPLKGFVAGVVIVWFWRQYDTRPTEPDHLLTGARLVGLIVVVPIMEELFRRSFLMRWLTNHDVLNVDPRSTRRFAFCATAGLFALEHHLWLAGLIAGVVFNALYIRIRTLWAPITAHAVATTALSIYIVTYGR